MTDQSRPYTRPAVLLHWAVALLIFVALPVGVYMHGLPLSPQKIKLFNYHKWMGVTVFLLAALRAAWRFTHRPPALPAAMRAWERFAARIEVELHGQKREMWVPLTVTGLPDSLQVTGGFVLRQTDFGAKPYYVLGGLIAVRDEVVIEFKLHAR